MAKAPLSENTLTPFLGPVLLDATGTATGEALLKALVKDAKGALVSAGGVTRKIIHDQALQDADGFRLHALVCEERRQPGWVTESGLRNISYGLVILAVKGKRAALNASDGDMRERILRALTSVRLAPRSAIEPFIGAEASVLYLNGVHTPTAVKPNSKALTGSALEYALDPLGDQTYALSALRSRPDVTGLKDAAGRSRSVGAAPAGARVWVGPSRDWASFTADLDRIFVHAGTKVAEARLALLAQEKTDTSGIQDAYDIALVPPALLTEDQVDPGAYDLARRWAYESRFEIVGTDGPSVTLDCSIGGEALGRGTLTVAITDGDVELSFNWQDANKATTADHRACEAALTDPQTVKIYYESSHAIAQGRCYQSTATDRPFPWKFQPFTPYDVDQEKPTREKDQSLADAMLSGKDTSLFAFVREKVFVDAAGKPSGWLACDDGSMELADFIHLDPATKVVTLVHVKASGSTAQKRMASVADFEIVVSQAVKNLRHLDRRNLAVELERGKEKSIATAVWLDGDPKGGRDEFIAAVKALKSRYTKVAMIVQPRLTQREFEACMDPDKAVDGRLMRMRQLNTLLLASRLSAMACGADLVAIADGEAT